MKKIIIAAVAAVLSGCATSTGVIPIGQDTYMIAIGGKTTASGGKLKAAAFQEASAYCSQQSRQFQVVNTQQRDMSFGRDPSAEIQFMCLDKNDPELVRPKLRKEADSIVEIRK